MTDFRVQKVTALAWVNLDEDGTPLNLHGERMLETSPGAWEEPLIVEALRFFEKAAGACHSEEET